MDWQKELSERMQEFRRRRARISMGKEEDDEKNLNLDFEPPASGPGKSAASPNVVELPSFDELDLREDASTGLRQDWDSLGKEKVSAKADRRGAPSTGARQVRIQPPPTDPMEIELDSSPASAGLIGSRGDASALKVASLSKRFLAGFFDFLVLLSAGGVFALIFWRAGGRLPLLPLNLVVAALIGVIFLMAYFGVFTVLASGTPGLIWAGLEVRTFEGNAPKQIDCFWRSFGYLVSVSAFMLGFIWSLVDSEGLTWHDRMSRTLLVDTRDQEALQAATEVSP